MQSRQGIPTCDPLLVLPQNNYWNMKDRLLLIFLTQKGSPRLVTEPAARVQAGGNVFLTGSVPLLERAGWCGGSTFCPGSCCISPPVTAGRSGQPLSGLRFLHRVRGSSSARSLLLPWPETAAWDGFLPWAWGCSKERGGKRRDLPSEVMRTGPSLKAITGPMDMGCSCTVSPWDGDAEGQSWAVLGYMGQ